MDNNAPRLENNARRMWPEIALFSIRSSLFSTFATVGTGHKQNFTSVILYMNIIYIAKCWFEILHCSGPFARRHKLFKPRNTSKQTRVEFFYRENMTSFLNYDLKGCIHLSRSLYMNHSYAKGPFCVARLRWWSSVPGNNAIYLGPQSLCNWSFWWRFCVVTLLFGFFCGCKGFCHRTESDLFLFLRREINQIKTIPEHLVGWLGLVWCICSLVGCSTNGLQRERRIAGGTPCGSKAPQSESCDL